MVVIGYEENTCGIYNPIFRVFLRGSRRSVKIIFESTLVAEMSRGNVRLLFYSHPILPALRFLHYLCGTTDNDVRSVYDT